MTSLPDPSETPQRPDPPADGAVRGEDENVGTEQHAPSAPDAPAQPERAQSGHDASTTTATAAVSAAASWLSRVGHNVRDYATAAGKQFDRAADSINDTVDHMTQQVGDAYGQRMARQTAAAYEERDRHRAALETSIPPDRHQQALQASDQLLQQCMTLAGDIQAEVQYASKDTPLGRESYGLMMLVNILVPFLEHGLRPDWKSVLPAATVTSASARWLQNMAVKARNGRPAVYDMLQAADSGWAKGESNLLGFNSLDFSSIPGEVRRVQAWLHDSLNRGSLAHRLQTLILLKPLLEDWYFPWALLRQDAQLAELLTELVKVESNDGLIHLPLEQLHAAGGTTRSAANTTAWTQKMRDAFTDLAGKATHVYEAASESVSHSVTKAKAAVSPKEAPVSRESSPPLRTQSALSQLSDVDDRPERSQDGTRGANEIAGTTSLAALHTNEAYAVTQSEPTSTEESPVRAGVRGGGGLAAAAPAGPPAKPGEDEPAGSPHSGDLLGHAHDEDARELSGEVGDSEEMGKMVSVPVPGDGEWSAGLESPAAQGLADMALAEPAQGGLAPAGSDGKGSASNAADAGDASKVVV